MNSKQYRILAIAPSTRGFGFAVLEGRDILVNWGVRNVKKGDKNTQSVEKVQALIAHYEPGVLVLQTMENSRRAPRIKALSRKIISVALTHKINVALFSDEQVRRIFFGDNKGTKQELAEILAQRFPAELGSRVPPKRKAWMSEDGRMDIFAAVALAVTFRLKTAKNS